MRPVPGNEGRGCSDHGCVWGHPGGRGTNGGCKCLPMRAGHLTLDEVRDIRAGVYYLNREIKRLRAEKGGGE